MKTLIKKWQDKHAAMLDYYNMVKGLSENELLFLRSEMKNTLEFIEDLKDFDSKTKKQRDELLEALKDLFDECAILRKQIPLKDQNILNPKHKKAYERYSSRMIDAEQAIKNAT